MVEREILTPEGVPLSFRIAPAMSRASAFLADSLAMLVILVPIGLLASVAGDLGQGVLLVAFFVLRIFWFIGFELSARGATPGKRLMGVRVIDAKGGPLAPRSVFARNLVREAEFFVPLAVILNPKGLYGTEGWPALLAAVWALIFLFLPLFNRERLRMGDLIAGTRVVNAPTPVLEEDLGAQSAQETRYAFTAEQLGHYGEKELQVLEELLRRDAVDFEALELVCRKILKRIDYPESLVNTERFLRDFYAAQRARLERGMLFGRRRKDKAAARAAKGRRP